MLRTLPICGLPGARLHYPSSKGRMVAEERCTPPHQIIQIHLLFSNLQLLQSQLQFPSADATFRCAPQALSLCPSSVRTPRIRADALFQLNLLNLDKYGDSGDLVYVPHLLLPTSSVARGDEHLLTELQLSAVYGVLPVRDTGFSGRCFSFFNFAVLSQFATSSWFTRVLPVQRFTKCFKFARLSPPFLT